MDQQGRALSSGDQAQDRADVGDRIAAGSALGLADGTLSTFKRHALTQRRAEDQRVKTCGPVKGVPRVTRSSDQRLQARPPRIVADQSFECTHLRHGERKGGLPCPAAAAPALNDDFPAKELRRVYLPVCRDVRGQALDEASEHGHESAYGARLPQHEHGRAVPEAATVVAIDIAAMSSRMTAWPSASLFIYSCLRT